MAGAWGMGFVRERIVTRTVWGQRDACSLILPQSGTCTIMRLNHRELLMYARVWRANILPGKVEEHTAAVRAVVPILRRRAGFRSLVLLRGGSGDRLESMVVSVWESLVTLRDSETAEFERAVAHVLSFCERHPSMREEEVLLDEFVSSHPGGAIDPDDTITKF